MRRSVIVICCFLIISFLNGSAQNTSLKDSRSFKDGIGYIQVGDVTSALPIFHRLVKTYPSNPEVYYYLGYCYLNTSGEPDSALIYFKKGVELLAPDSENSQFGIDLRYSLAKSYHLTLKTSEAIAEYEKVLSLLPNNEVDLFRDQVKRDIVACGYLAEAVKTPVGLITRNVGSTINSTSDDHSPIIMVDESIVFFTTRRPSSYSELLPDGQHSEKIYYSKKDEKTGEWTKPVIINKLFQKEGHESCVSLSADGTELYLFRNDIDGKNIYVCFYDGSNWSEPIKMDKPINSDFNETHITLAPDKSFAYFTSDRPGGLGGLDVYEIRRLPNGTWGLPRNLGPEINTPFDEETPMLHPDGKTFYFSSEGHTSIGGLDIFMSRINNDSTLAKPLNMGFPINTPDDDFFFVPTVNYNQAWYSSARFKDTKGRHDIYMLEYKQNEESRLSVLSGEVTSDDNAHLENVRIAVTDLTSNSNVGVYKPHPGTGKYLLILEYGKQYQIDYSGEGYVSAERKIDVTYDMTYSKLAKSSVIDPVHLIAIQQPKDDSGKSALASNTVGDKVITDTVDDGIPYYTVQILTLKKPVNSWEKAFKGLDQSLITEYKCKNSIYRYAYGKYKGYKLSLKGKAEVLENTPFSDSFIIDVKQYEKLLNNE